MTVHVHGANGNMTMASYSHLYCEERDAHERTKRQLASVQDRLEDLFSFIREKRLQDEFAEWVVSRDVAGRNPSTDTGSVT